MQKSHIVLVASLVLIIVVISTVSTFLVMQSRLERAVAEAESKLRQQKIDQLTDDMAKRESDFKSWMENFEKQSKQVKTSQDVAHTAPLPQAQGGLLFNPFTSMVTTDPSTGKTEEKATVTEDKIVPLYQHLRTCDAREKDFLKCEADKKDLQEQVAVVTKDRDKWRETAKGGSKASRVWYASKVAGCAGLGALAGSQRDAKSAAIGATAAALLCSLTMKH